MLATQTGDGDLRVWSVSKPATVEAPRVIRVLKRSDTYVPSRSWVSWSKNGRIVQFSEGKTWAWDVRTKHVTYEPVPTIDGVRAIACHGPTGTLFTLGPDYTIQQYDIERAVLVANVRHMPLSVPPTPPEDTRGPIWTTSESEEELASPLVRARGDLRAAEAARTGRNNIPSPQSAVTAPKISFRTGINEIISPAGRTDYTTTSFDTGIQTNSTFNQPPVQLPNQMYQPQSPVAARSSRKGSRLKQEVVMSPEERVVTELFPYTRARLHDCPYRPPRSLDDSHMTPDDLRMQMLSVVFGWEADIQDLIRDELSRQPTDSQNAVLLAKWLDEDPDHLAEIMGSTGLASNYDWMLLALGTISNQVAGKKITQVFIEKMLSKGDIHAAATLMLALGDKSDAIEVYVSRHQYMEAVLLTCVVTPDDWQRQSYLVRRWGEHVVENSQQSLAIRCFSCTGVEPSDPWTSPIAKVAPPTILEAVASPRTQQHQVQNLEPMEYPAIFQKTLERRRTLDAPTPVAMPAPHIMQSMAAPPTPFRNAAAQGTRITPQTSALKLVTSFGAQPNINYKFPGLKPEDRTPTVAAAVTPIAESAIDRSALSPGGLGSYRMNNIRSINSALSAKTATPGGFQPSRLPAIGETPVDVESPRFPSSLPQRSISVPAELTNPKASDSEEEIPVINEPQRGKQPPLTLLTSARYESSSMATPVRETPQTAVGPQTAIKFPASSYNVLSHDEDLSRYKTGSRSRKPDGLSIQTGHVSTQEFLPASSYGELLSRPATTGSYSNTQLDTTGDLTSPPTTGQSYNRSVKSPLVTGRSIDQYISSLEQAQYYSKHARARGYSSTSKQSRDDVSERKKGRDEERDPRRAIPAAKRSPSSPIPMSPEDLRMYSTSVESFETLYSSNYSGIDRSGTPASISKLSRRGSQSTAKGTKARKRSQSRQTGPRSKSRQHSPEPALFSPRGRSASRKENLGHRSPSSPRPMVPSEEDRQSRFDNDSALRLVSRDRHRLHRSTSRQPGRSTSARRDRSPDRRRARDRSRSRQAEEAPSLSRKPSRNERHRRNRRPSDAVYERSAHPDDAEDSMPSDAFPPRDVLPRSDSHAQLALDRGRAQTPAEQLEARRLSLTRRPSVPNVPVPIQPLSHGKSASTGNATLPFSRSYTDEGPTTGGLMDEYTFAPEVTGLGVSTGRPTTPRAMQVDPAIPEDEVAPAPATLLLSSDVYRPPTRGEDISRPGSTRAPASLEFLTQIPKHPAYDRRIANSRSSSKGAEARASSRSRATSRDRTRVSPREMASPPMPMASPPIGTTETVVYASPAAPQRPLILPELQHLMQVEPTSPPPPPPPPPPPKMPHFTGSPNLSNLRGFDPEAANMPLPMSAVPTTTTFTREDIPLTANTIPLSAGPMTAGSGHRRGRSGADNVSGSGGGGSGGGQLFSKLRNFTGRNRSPSRGRKGADDNQAMSPRMAGIGESMQPAPYESIPSAMMGNA